MTRHPPTSTRTATLYPYRPIFRSVVTVSNTSNPAVTLAGRTRSVAGMVDVHETVKDGTIMKMAPAGPIEIPAGGRLEMEPGGYHIMLMALKRAVKKGETLTLALHFSDGTEIKAAATVM